MKFSLSKSIVSVICIFLSIQFMFTGAGFLIAKYKQHKEMEAWMKTPEAEKYLEKLVFEKTETKKLNWHEENEFEWEGEFYDVSKKIEKNNKVIIYCFNDKKDNDIHIAFKRHQKKNEKKNMKGPKLLTLYFINKTIKLPSKEIDLKGQLNLWSVFLPSPLITVASPPPDLT